MTDPTFDADGYPTDETLDAIRHWPADDPRGLFDFIERAWHRMGSVEHLVGQIRLVTGGWSGNESLIAAMRESESLAWPRFWRASYRGGLYIFDEPEDE